MSYDFSARANKHPKHPKVFFSQYMFNSNEPIDDRSNDLPAELEAELLGNTPDMRREFRSAAQRIRDHY